VEQHIIEGVTDLAGEQSERIDLGAVGDAAESRAHVGASQVSPIALGLKPEYPGAGLPAITELTTGDAAGRIMRALRRKRRANEIPLLAARSPAAVGTDVEAAPIIDRGDHLWGRRGVGLRGKIGGRGWRSRTQCQAQCNKSRASQQKLFHLLVPASFAQLLFASLRPRRLKFGLTAAAI